MTCFDKFKLIRPTWDEESTKDVLNWDCPSDYGIMPDPDHCMCGAVTYQCEECWNREVEESD